MKTFVFVGPTVSTSEVTAILGDVVCLPPVAQGDLVRLFPRKPRAFGIIDGFFERVPAVWHKEILGAMERGIHVFGSASMGALRAAELHPFGMVGVGRIFEDFRDGVLEDDDEVAVIHGPPENGYVAMSVAMVNIRRTLSKAAEAGVISLQTEGGLLAIAKGLFYPLRDYRTIVREGLAAGYPSGELSDLQAWVGANRVDQKREDALEMLKQMKSTLLMDDGPKRVNYKTEHTEFWDVLQREAGMSVTREQAGYSPLPLDLLLDEVRLDPEAYQRIQHETVMRCLVVNHARRDRRPVNEEMIEEALNDFRDRWALSDEASLDNWLALNDLDRSMLHGLVESKALADYHFGSFSKVVEPEFVFTMMINNEYYQWVQSYEHKRDHLLARGFDNPGLQDVGLTAEELLEWFLMGQNVPMPQDVQKYSRSLGFRDFSSFLQAIIKDYIYKMM